MKIKKVIVEEIPEGGCNGCDQKYEPFNPITDDHMNCNFGNNPRCHIDGTRHPDCPLEVEVEVKEIRLEPEHECQYCHAMVRQPDEVCYMNPNKIYPILKGHRIRLSGDCTATDDYIAVYCKLEGCDDCKYFKPTKP
jgi:hypothetical protein